MQWETIIGLEVHAQLSTQSKIFSGASTEFGEAPNVHACAVDIAFPGVLPLLNKAAVEKAIRFGLAVDAKINHRSVFARKNYFYPDLPKGYQISQYEIPIVQGGQLQIASGDSEKTVRLTRAHLEEDAGKSIHGEALSAVPGYGIPGLMVPGIPLVNESRNLRQLSGIDLNRAGTPLLEIVSEPDMRSAAEAVAYAKALHSLVRWIDICDGNMQEGSFRFDANVSVRRKGSDKLGTRCEIKNLNSFHFLERAIEFEVKRQIEILEDSGAIVQETRLYDPEKDETRSMRTKEEAHDYRYFPDPDLLPLEVTEELLNRIRTGLPELPQSKRERYEHEYGLSAYDTALLTQSREMADYFEAVVTNKEVSQFDPKRAAKVATNFITGDLSAILNRSGTDLQASRIQPPALAGLIALVLDNKISVSTAKSKVLEKLWEHGEETVGSLFSRISPSHPKLTDLTLYTIKQDEFQLSSNSTATATIVITFGDLWPQDNAELTKIVDEVLAKNATQVEDYRAGKEKAFNSLVGQVMKATKGKANPAQLNEILKRKLAG